MSLALWRGLLRRRMSRLPVLPPDRTSPPAVIWAGADARPVAGLACPNCSDGQPKPLVLTVDFTPPRRARQIWRVVACPRCTCKFYERQAVADYGDDEMLTRGRAALYLQQGAGLAQLVRPIARMHVPAGARYLDIGCGFGFGLDFAVRGNAWRGHGIDPAQIAALGRDRLGLPIEQRLLAQDEPDWLGGCDVVMAAETIEHVPSPLQFLGILKATLKPSGVLVLTTPDADAIQPHTPPGQLVGLLSPELHLVLQSEQSLRMLLRDAGFGHVRVERDGGGLVAHASTAPFDLDPDDRRFRAAYRHYLEQRVADFPITDDLFWGFAGRAFLEAANAGDTDSAARLRDILAPACRTRFGIDLDAPVLPAETDTCSLERMCALMPLNFATICYAAAMLALANGAPRPTQEARLLCAASAADRLRRAVGELAMEDALSEDLGWVAAAEALLCAAASADAHADFPARAASLPPAPGGDAGRREAILTRAFTGLVNAGRIDDARALAGSCAWLSPASLPAPDRSDQRDAVFCRAIADLQPGGDAARAQRGFAWVCANLQQTEGEAATSQPSGLYWAALRGEMQAFALLGEGDKAALLWYEALRAVTAIGGSVPPDVTAPVAMRPLKE